MKKHSQRTSNNNDTAKSRETKRKRNEWRVTKMVLAIFLSFLICYLPITIVKIVDQGVRHLCKYAENADSRKPTQFVSFRGNMCGLERFLFHF